MGKPKSKEKTSSQQSLEWWMSLSWAGRPPGTARWPTCLPDTQGGLLCPTLPLNVQGRVSWLENTDSKHPPVCVGVNTAA